SRRSQRNLLSHQRPYDSSPYGNNREPDGRRENYSPAIPMASMRHGSEYRESFPRADVQSRSPYGKFHDNRSFEPEPEWAYSPPSPFHLLDGP
ncbi:hypothetical protein Anapl_00976, partial [Anas platyrhynchos]